MSPVETLTTRLAAIVVGQLANTAPERILNFPTDAREAISRALHSSYPVSAESESEAERYSTIKEAAKVIEDFHGGKL